MTLLNRGKVVPHCENCGTIFHLVHCGQGKYACKHCLDTMSKKRMRELK